MSSAIPSLRAARASRGAIVPLVPLVPLVLFVGTAMPAAAQQARAAFVSTLGKDTISVEQFTRDRDRVVGDVIRREGGTSVMHYVITLGADGRPAAIEYTVHRGDGSMPPNAPRSTRATFGADSVITVVTRDSAVTRRVAVAGAVPYLFGVLGTYEGVIAAARRSGRDSTTVMGYTPGGQQATAIPVRFVGRDSARVWIFGAPFALRLGRDGEILAIDGRQTTDKIVATREPRADIAGLASRFAAADAAGHGFARQASPRDTARATVGGANVWVDYGRPSARGRDVWGGRGVLGDTLWRTGANAATQLTTDRDLVIEGKTIPAGTYSLWTHVGAAGTELVFNRQTKQWGTEYHPEQDLVRVPLRVSPASPPVEQFTIAVRSDGPGGVLELAWANRRLSLPFTVK